MLHRIETYFLLRLLLVGLIVSSCSVEIDQTTVGITPSPSVEENSAPRSISLFPTTHVPITWADLNLSGKLIYLSSTTENNSRIANIQFLDLTSGSITTVFSAPPDAWIYYAAISPDAKRLIMSYAPPAQTNSVPNRALYIMPLDATAPPQPLFMAPTPDDHYTQAEWSPDGMYIYFVHYNHNNAGGKFYEDYEIFRMTYPNGDPEKILDHAFWPRLSSDSSKLVYVSLDPASGLNELFIANADGNNIQKVSFSGPWIPDIIDAPIFLPDGKSILFSTPGPSQSYQPNWLDKMMGVQVAKAHSIPSDWWSIPISGGVPTRLTNIQTINLFPSISPDKHRVASYSGDGLFVMNPDGTNLTRLIPDTGGFPGTVNWIP